MFILIWKVLKGFKLIKDVKTMYLSENDKSIIVDFLVKKLKPKFIYLFGSFAKGEGRDDSDIDLAVYLDEEINPYELFIVANELSFEVKKDVQIIDLKKIDTVFAAQIVGNREELYSIDEYLKANYNMKTFREYAKLNEERQIILDRIEKEGKIYG